MKQIFVKTSRYLSIILFTAIIAFGFNSCKVSMLPDYNATITEQINTTAMKVDKFYLSMQESTTQEKDGRAYSNFIEDYVEIEVELNSLLSQNKTRPLNKNSTRICEITLQLWVKYKEEHKVKNTLPNGLLILNRKTFSDLFYAMMVAEKAKDILINYPETTTK